jgi:chemotaxis methyl-accepting protein methylase
MADRPRRDSDPSADTIADALAAAHGIDPRGSLALRARFDLALAEQPASAPTGPAELARIAQRLRVGETRFYRDPDQLDGLAEAVLPRAVAAGRLRVLSAGCSTGEEAWTLAAMLEDARGERPFAWEVVGLDALPESIERARAARYPASSIAAMPRRLSRFFAVDPRDGGDAREIRPTDALAARCRFVAGDLLATPLGGPYGLIVCRNVLIYFEEAAALRVLERLAGQLTRDGSLLVARAEVPIARRAGLLPRAVGAGRTVVFKEPGAPLSAPPPSRARASVSPASSSASPASSASTARFVARSVPPSSRGAVADEAAPPSRVCLELDDATVDALVVRGQELLAAGAPTIELRLSPRLPASHLDAIAAKLRRLVAAANVLGAKCVAADDASARAFAAVGLPITRG